MDEGTRTCAQHGITPLFHQTWRSSWLATHSRFAVASERSIRRLFPAFAYRLWLDRDIDRFVQGYVAAQLPELYAIYRALPEKIMKIDFVRYLWMYVFGGIYSDLDLIYSRSVEDLFTPNKAVYFFERAWTTGSARLSVSVHQAWLASAPRHPIWLDIMDFIGESLKSGQTEVLELTGPNGVSRAICELDLLGKYADVAVLPGNSIYQPGWTKTPRESAYCEHLTTHTWGNHRLLVPLRAVLNQIRSSEVWARR